jgi:hypothetical protein
VFPNIQKFQQSDPGPYERQMGRHIVDLLHLFAGRVPDAESYTCVLELAATPNHWSAGHAVFEEVRRLYLADMGRGDQLRCAQHIFEESCCQALYNAAVPPDPFDPSSAFFVAANALGLARLVGVPLDVVASVFASQ